MKKLSITGLVIAAGLIYYGNKNNSDLRFLGYFLVFPLALALFNQFTGDPKKRDATARPPVDGFAGPHADAVAEQETERFGILDQRLFSPPSVGNLRFGNGSGAGPGGIPTEGLAPPGSYRQSRRW